jgi:hypothetical protein
MGWLQLVGSLKLCVSFAKEPYKGDDILQTRRMILKSLRIVATLYECFQKGTWWMGSCNTCSEEARILFMDESIQNMFYTTVYSIQRVM